MPKTLPQGAAQPPESAEGYPEPLSNFTKGQWWIKELDAMVTDGTDDQKRAVAVVHHLLRTAAKPEALVAEAAGLTLKPMSSAPRPVDQDCFHLLVLDEWFEMGESCRGWALVYWLDPSDGRPGGWHERDCADLRNPIGWVLSTKDLPTDTAPQPSALPVALSDERMREALQRIERWFGEFPDTGRTWNDGTPMSYSAVNGSNGERDYMREIARAALSHPVPAAQEPKDAT